MARPWRIEIPGGRIGAVILEDDAGRLTNRWRAAKTNTYYTYDPVGNLTNVNYPASTDVKFQYDPLNRVTNMVDAAGPRNMPAPLAGSGPSRLPVQARRAFTTLP
jgi:YD repeat-containing protein